MPSSLFARNISISAKTFTRKHGTVTFFSLLLLTWFFSCVHGKRFIFILRTIFKQFFPALRRDWFIARFHSLCNSLSIWLNLSLSLARSLLTCHFSNNVLLYFYVNDLLINFALSHTHTSATTEMTTNLQNIFKSFCLRLCYNWIVGLSLWFAFDKHEKILKRQSPTDDYEIESNITCSAKQNCFHIQIVLQANSVVCPPAKIIVHQKMASRKASIICVRVMRFMCSDGPHLSHSPSNGKEMEKRQRNGNHKMETTSRFVIVNKT